MGFSSKHPTCQPGELLHWLKGQGQEDSEHCGTGSKMTAELFLIISMGA